MTSYVMHDYGCRSRLLGMMSFDQPTFQQDGTFANVRIQSTVGVDRLQAGFALGQQQYFHCHWH